MPTLDELVGSEGVPATGQFSDDGKADDNAPFRPWQVKVIKN